MLDVFLPAFKNRPIHQNEKIPSFDIGGCREQEEVLKITCLRW